MDTRILTALATVGLLGARAWASAPNVLTYQGRLLESGVPVSGARSIGVRLCDAPTGGACYDAGTQSVGVTNGVFKTTFTLATAPALPAIGLAGGTWHLELNVNATTLSPREQLTSAPFAVFASSAQTLSAASSTSPGVTISTNVGIGTAPSAPLHVFSGLANGARLLVESGGAGGNPARLEVRGGPAGSNAQLELNRPDDAGASLVDFQQAGASAWQLRFEGAASSNRLDVSETVGGVAAARLTAQPGGRVGVGLVAPTARLHVSSAAATSSDALFKASSGAAAGQEILTVVGDGFVGVGTTQPLQLVGGGPRLEVNGPANVVGQLSINGGSGFAAPVTVNGSVSVSGAVNLVGVGSSLTNSGNGGINPGSGGLTTAGNVTVTGTGMFTGNGAALTSVVRLVSSTTLTAAAPTMTLTLAENMRYLRVLIRVVGATVATNLVVQFNADVSAAYSYSRLTAGAQTTATSQTGIGVFSAPYGTSAVNIVLDAPNNDVAIKAGTLSAIDYVGAATVPGHVQMHWVWEEFGTPIGSIRLSTTAGSMLAGTSIAAYGSN